MKTIKYAIVFAVAMISCNQQREDNLVHERDSLAAVIKDRDESLNNFIESYNDIEKNLDAIAQKQNVISENMGTNPGELKSSVKDRINDEIKLINDLMEKNKAQVAELNKKLKNSSVKTKGLEKMINSLNEQITQKNNELAELNDRLTGLNKEVAQLQTRVDTLGTYSEQQAETIAKQTESMHTAYFIVGSQKELQESNVIDRKGGLLGIGKTAKLNADVSNDKFTKIDYTQTLTIPVNSEAQIVTAHPKDSYTLERDKKDKDKIIDVLITDPDKFWSTSKYLVVIKD